ncbi:hypothetical protein LCGC14_0868700 [marine sediment metagenome]|uniref:OsmC family protein n=1 Tax=marine sediment metagenome TaxID=412755 RepID=A0A0F9P5C3_9ZZZZ
MINRINIDIFKETIEKAKKEPSSSLKNLEIEGTWRLDKLEGPQFETKLKTEKAGEILVQSDETIILGGGGTAPNPVQYCIGGLLACYSATFVKWASMEGILLKDFKIRGTAKIDLSAALGISENPPINDLRIELLIKSDETMEKLLSINEIAKKRCPGYYCLTHGIIPQIDITKTE